MHATKVLDLNLYPYKEYKRNAILHVSLMDQHQKMIAENMASFVQDKDLALRPDEYSIKAVKVKAGIKLILTSKTLMRFVQLKYKNLEFSDNFFHLLANQKREIMLHTKDDKETVLKNITIRSLVDTY